MANEAREIEPAGNTADYQAHNGAEKGFRRGSSATVDLNTNLQAKIRNPLADIPEDELLTNVDTFVHEKGLEQYAALFRKGALVAQDPSAIDEIGGANKLDQAEIDALVLEANHKWRVPKMLYLTIITCSIGAAVQGWDQEGSNGANLSFPTALGIGGTSDHDVFLVGFINAAPFVGSAFIGCWCADPLNFRFGRRGAIFIAAIFCFLPVLGSGFVQTWPQLIVCRLLLGIGMGIKASSVPIFAAENAPANIRGALVMTWQLWTAFGILLGTAANLILGRVGDIAWRLQFASAFIPAIPLMLLIYFCPESPRWLMKKNRYSDAMASLLRLRNTPLQAARDVYYIHAQISLERDIIGNASYVGRFIELFTIPRLRRATLASFVVMIGQQMCGINIIAFYSGTVFVNAGADQFTALIASFGFGLVNFFFAFPAIWTIDTFGRRSLLLFTFPNMAWTLLCAGLLTLIPGTGGTHLGLVALFIYLFAAFYSPGEGPVPFVYSAEVFPLSHREVGMAWAVSTNLFWAAVLSLSFPKILDSLGVIGSFCLYAGFNVVAFCLIFLFVPETKQRTLEELDYIFAVPVGTFIKYQFSTWLPYFIKRYLLCNRRATLKPLYQFELEGTRKGKTEHTTDKQTSVGETEFVENQNRTNA